jgi:signal transduction histidine kinase
VASVVPFRVRLAEGGALVALFDADEARLREVDERELLISFADHASLALDRALAVDDMELLAVLSDRERIARDLHDTVIQRLFALGLHLQAVALTGGPELGERLRRSVEDVDSTIRDIRATIFELQTQGANTLNYGLYRETARTNNWGNTPGTDTPPAVTAPVLATPLTVYGRIPAGQNVRTGNFSDTIMVPVTY